MKNLIKEFIILTLLFVVIFALPLIVIACVNQVFNAGVEYTLLNWFCVGVLIFIFAGRVHN